MATEGAAALVAHAFSRPGIERVVASTMAVNSAVATGHGEAPDAARGHPVRGG
ncbi:MAG: hypothetical protein R2734_02740 [Nocardioides sp.]